MWRTVFFNDIRLRPFFFSFLPGHFIFSFNLYEHSLLSTFRSMALRCQPCDMIFNGNIPYQAHMNSQKHRKKVQNFQNAEVHSGNLTQSTLDKYIKKNQYGYICVSCNVTLNSTQQAEFHVLGQKHMRQLERMVLLPHEEDASSVSVSSYEPKISESLTFPFTLNFQNIPIETVMASITVFDIDDPVHF